jgi:hypothetical protein
MARHRARCNGIPAGDATSFALLNSRFDEAGTSWVTEIVKSLLPKLVEMGAVAEDNVSIDTLESDPTSAGVEATSLSADTIGTSQPPMLVSN